MRKNQKHTREDMFRAVEMCKESNLTQKEFCKKEGLAFGTFKYWHKKYQVQNIDSGKSKETPFIPIEVAVQDNNIEIESITISYPNGIQVCCSTNISTQQLKTLLKS